MKSRLSRPCPGKEVFLKAFMGGLPEEEKARFAFHLLACSRCQETFSVLRQLEFELKSREKSIEAVSLSPDDERALKKMARQRLKELREGRARPFWRPLSVKVLAVAASLLLIGLAAYLLVYKPPSDQALRGISSGGLRLVKPEGKLKEAPSVFLWTDIEGRAEFLFELIDDELNLIYREKFGETKAQIPETVRQKLGRGKIFLWTVSARNKDDRILASASCTFEIE